MTGRYAAGGPVHRPGLTLVTNTSGRPERVLRPDEWAELANVVPLDECDGADRPAERDDNPREGS